MKTTNAKIQSVRSIKWSYAGTFIPKVLTPAVYFCLARLLVPEDFGLIATAYLVISFVEITREAGIGSAVIQSEADELTIFSLSFYQNIVLGVFFYAVVFLIAPAVAAFFKNQDATSVLRVLSFQILISSLSLSYQSILQKRLDFKNLFYINLIPSATLILITLPIAYWGGGVWSLVYGNLCASLFRALSLFLALPWKPRWVRDRIELKKMIRFGFYCYLEALLSWIYVWGDKAILGGFVLTAALGEYMFAYRATGSIINLFLFPIAQIVYPFLCQEKHSTSINDHIYKLLSYFAIISLFLALILYHTASTLPFFLGSKWLNIIFPVKVLSLSLTLSMIFTVVIPDGIKAFGKPNLLVKFQFFKLFYTLPLFFLGAHLNGVNGFCVAKLVTVCIGCLLFCWLGGKVLNLEYLRIYTALKTPFGAFFLSFFLISLLKSSLLDSHQQIVIVLGVISGGTGAYFGLLWCLDRFLIKDFVRHLTQAFPVVAFLKKFFGTTTSPQNL